MKFITIPVVCLLVGLLFTPAIADTRYISDVLVVTVRNNTTANYQVLERLTSNTPVTVIGEDDDFFHIQTPSGTEGYTLKQYITSQIPKDMIIEDLQAEIDNLQADYAALEERLRTLQETDSDQPNQADLIVQLEETRTNLRELQEEYDNLRESSADSIKLYEDNQFLEEQNQMLTREVEVLREENSSFHRTNMIQWFLAGAGVFFGGWLIGKISRQKPRGFSR
ncbi:MAG: TIGR04211 family SH3 domain-containing protein [Pelovirga sp.]